MSVSWKNVINNVMYAIPITVAFVLGLVLGSWGHPYEECKRMYTLPEDQIECIWIKENP